MTAVYLDAPFSDAERRERLYAGDLFVYSATPGTRGLCDFARSLVADAFAPYDPAFAQNDLPVEKYVEILAKLKPAFIHHPESKRWIREILKEFGCDLAQTYFDVPRMRTSTHGGYLTAGLAYAFHLHRDTWYSAPHNQLNWWLPIYEIEPSNAMAFHPRYFGQAVPNDSREYNYYEWNATSRKAAAQQIGTDTRQQPHAAEPLDPDPQIRLICPAGGLILFSGAQMHSTVPNTSGRTRFSIDFRTVNAEDVAQRRGAVNVDSECTGTTLRDYLRGTDLTRLPDELVRLYDDETADRGELVYRPPFDGHPS